MIEFLHIAPIKYTHLLNRSYRTLALAHLIDEKPEYTKQLEKSYVYAPICDNSAFEMYKQGKPMFAPEKLIELGNRVQSRYLVLPDYPGEHSSKTIEAAKAWAPQFRHADFGTFFVPQSLEGDLEDYISCFLWAATSPLVDYIGVSILGVPLAYGVERNNKLQRYMSRWTMMNELSNRGILQLAKRNGKKIHFLGMVDGPNEILLCGSKFEIDTWDSSAAVWAGLNGIAFDSSPTGLVNGKFEKEVDFDFNNASEANIQLAIKNMKYIGQLCVLADKQLKASKSTV